MQQRNRQDEGAKEPVRHVDVLDLAHTNRAKKHDGIRHPDQGNQYIDRPLKFGIFLARRVSQGQTDDGRQNDQLPTPKGKWNQRATKQARLAGALHHVIAGSKQCAAAKRKNHRIGMQRA
ncbi:hypothetical protein D3C71_1931950 [compost metagenome]